MTIGVPKYWKWRFDEKAKRLAFLCQSVLRIRLSDYKQARIGSFLPLYNDPPERRAQSKAAVVGGIMPLNSERLSILFCPFEMRRSGTPMITSYGPRLGH